MQAEYIYCRNVFMHGYIKIEWYYHRILMEIKLLLWYYYTSNFPTTICKRNALFPPFPSNWKRNMWTVHNNQNRTTKYRRRRSSEKQSKKKRRIVMMMSRWKLARDWNLKLNFCTWNQQPRSLKTSLQQRSCWKMRRKKKTKTLHQNGRWTCIYSGAVNWESFKWYHNFIN